MIDFIVLSTLLVKILVDLGNWLKDFEFVSHLPVQFEQTRNLE